MEEIDEEEKQKTELLSIKEFISEQKHEIRDIKTTVSFIMNCLEELKTGQDEIKSMERQG